MKKAQSEYYRNYIEDNSSDQRKLFHASKQLLKFKNDTPFPPHCDVLKLANYFGNFFRQKIVSIRSQLPNLVCPDLSNMEQQACPNSRFSEFVSLFGRLVFLAAWSFWLPGRFSSL
jgi:hypothetical protein